MSEPVIEFQVSTAHLRVAAILDRIGDSRQVSRAYRPVLCALWNTILILAQNELPDIVDVWNEVYPDAQMDEMTPAPIALAGIDFAEKINPVDPGDIDRVMQKLCDIGLHGLAHVVKSLLTTRGYRF